MPDLESFKVTAENQVGSSKGQIKKGKKENEEMGEGDEVAAVLANVRRGSKSRPKKVHSEYNMEGATNLIEIINAEEDKE